MAAARAPPVAVVEWVRGRGREGEEGNCRNFMRSRSCECSWPGGRGAAAAALSYPPWKTVSILAVAVGSQCCIFLFVPYPFSSSVLAACTRGREGRGRAEAIPKFRGKLSERRIINEIRCIPDTIRPSPANRKKDDTHYSIERL